MTEQRYRDILWGYRVSFWLALASSIITLATIIVLGLAGRLP